VKRSCVLLINGNIVVSQQNMDFIKPEPDPGGTSFQSSAHSDHEVTNIKQDEDPMGIHFQLMKTENEVSCIMCPLLNA
jgi:hypothetical protein